MRLSPGYMAVDMDTKKLDDDAWEKVADRIESVLGGMLPHNTTHDGWFHGHYIFEGSVPDGVAGKLSIDGVVVGDVIRPEHRYLATGGGYLCRWFRPPALPSGLLPWVEMKPKAAAA